MWKQGLVTSEKYRNAFQTCRDGVRKVKAQMRLNSARNVRNNKGIYWYNGENRHTKESIRPLIMRNNNWLQQIWRRLR